ncbi:MAG: SDR family oxidoreductase [Candidatus Binatia bacterium]|nr:SDR family oxidoreductase [Candidatus Binatia bacterium]
MSHPFELAVLTPVAWPDFSLAIAASRTGSLGILNCECEHTAGQLFAHIGRLARYQGLSFGVQVAGTAGQFLDRLATGAPAPVTTVILTSDGDALERQIAALRRRRIRVLFSVTCVAEALVAERLGVDGVIAKGHEAGGWVGEETAFVLLQRLLARKTLPVWVHGGVGVHTVAACYAAGAAGVILDSQMVLVRESTLPEHVRTAVARMDGSETLCIGAEIGVPCRVYARPRLPVVEELQQVENALAEDARAGRDVAAAWRQAVRTRVGWESADQLWFLGQDAAFAALFARRFRTVAGVIQGLRESIASHCRLARQLRPLDAGGPLARSHGTRYPIVQGPMTRVSDTPAFAESVARNGALPFLALALLRGEEVRTLLTQTAQRLGNLPWGVGILGFVPLALRQEQLAAIQAVRPPFALIAGGRPDQALSLEQSGIPTYLHVPSPGLLTMFLESGARRFVFEGRECGGHVGPRTSFVLWELMINVLLDKVPPAPEAEQYHVLFAGGIHDALSAAMVATLSAPLAERGVRLGVLLGTAYLFTTEAVDSGAIVSAFQEEALRCQRTVLLETGPGHATRCSDTPFALTFAREKQRLKNELRLSPEEIRDTLEGLNLGRLRIAAKGIAHNPRHDSDPAAPRFLQLDEAAQQTEGMYMIGQVAALRQQVCTMAELHHDVAVAGSARLASLVPEAPQPGRPRITRPVDIAIIGMACVLPKAPDLRRYWENILSKVDAITEIPPERWDWRRYYDPHPSAPDKVSSKWGGFIDPVPFDPTRYGMPPNTLPSIEPVQLLTLEVTRAALADAGYAERPFPRERTGIILGVGGGAGDLGQQYAVRANLPLYLENVPAAVWHQLPQWTEDSFAGILLNVVAGRVANRFDLGGVNYTVDAACASSLAAVYAAVRELEAGTADMMLVGGADTVQNPFAYLCFSKTQALSPRGRCRPFDAEADGIAISEGVAMLVLKRLEDAERDGDRIYAVIKAVAGSSDGRDRGLTAPRPEGQIRALERAYQAAGFGPETVSLIDAHGTGTVAGDQAEVESLTRVFAAHGAAPRGCAIGSVKSMIGHTKCTAGVAGLIKVALALHHRVLPPTLHVERPNPKAFTPESPFYVNTEGRPWLPHKGIRRAGVSSFGFGGTNFHAVLEEYPYDEPQATVTVWPAELFLWNAPTRQELVAILDQICDGLAAGATPALRDLAYSVWLWSKAARSTRGTTQVTLAIVATSLDDLREKLGTALERLRDARTITIADPRGVYYSEAPLAREGQIAFLFPGQGSQSIDMLRDLAIHFSEVRAVFAQADEVLAGSFPLPLSAYIFPPPRFRPEEERAYAEALTQTQVAQPALGAASCGLLTLLRMLEIEPDMTAGHSYGEYVALCAAGVFPAETLFALSEARGRAIVDSAPGELGTMAAVYADREKTQVLLDGVAEVWLANLNAPAQTIIAGTRRGIEQAVQRCEAAGVRVRPIPVACGFHSPLVAPARDRLAAHLATTSFAAPRIPVFSNTLAAPYPRDPQAIAAVLTQHLVEPVRFTEQIEAMYQAGARLFVEVGPGNVLTSLVAQILTDRPHLAVAPGAPGRLGLVSLQFALAQLAAYGVPVNLDRLFRGREVRTLDLAALVKETQIPPLPATAWLVHGGRAWPAQEEPARPPVPVALAAERTNLPRENGAASQHEGGNGGTDVPLSLASAPEEAGQLAAVSPTGEGAAAVMVQFQRLMEKFLETQRSVMLAYLQTAPAATQQLPYSSATPQQPLQSAATGNGVDARPNRGTLRPKQGNDLLSPRERAAHKTGRDTLREREANGINGAAREPAALGHEQLTQTLLQIVSERTGYPPEMLDLDLNMEADLGIDSIKRVEILGVLQQTALSSLQEHEQELMERLTGSKTLREIVETVLQVVRRVGESDRPGPRAAMSAPALLPSTAVVAQPADSDVYVPRFRLTAVASALPRGAASPLPDRPLLLTDDQRGVARAVASLLRTRGVQCITIRHGVTSAKQAADCYTADLTDPAAIEELCGALRREYGPLGGILHLLPLRQEATIQTLTRWREDAALDVQSLFLFVRNLQGDFLPGGEGSAKSCVVAMTALGGQFASDWVPEMFAPVQGGVAGLVKTVALEWPAVHCKVIDVEAQSDPALIANLLFQELCSADGSVEVGYRGGQRFLLQPCPAQPGGSDLPPLEPGSVVLITGGARGITAAIACELAARYRPTLLLIGRSPLPPEAESVETVGLAGVELKKALIQCLSQGGRQVSPAQVEAAYTRLLQDREIRQNLAVMRESGATVRYIQLDVRDERAFRGCIEEVYGTYGRLDGVIHGAGVIEDKLLQEKTLDSFLRVFDTKVASAFVLSQTLRPESLKFLVFFSSIAGRFGNRGQGDYAAANEVLNKLAVYLDRRWPARVVAINWGPWGGTGMVSGEVEKRFRERGVQVIPPAAGCQVGVEEIRLGTKGAAEIILGGGPWELLSPFRAVTDQLSLPLLEAGRATLVHRADEVEVSYEIDPVRDAYLQDHCIDGKPVFPLAMALELMAEVVQRAWPEWCVVGIHGVRVLRGIVLENGAVRVRVRACAQAQSADERDYRVEVAILDSAGELPVYYRGTVQLARRIVDTTSLPPVLTDLRPFPTTVRDAYQRWLFHGPLFQQIVTIEGISDNWMSAILRPSLPERCLPLGAGSRWVIDPIMVDCGFQLAILWARVHHDMTPLPSVVGTYRRFGIPSGALIRCQMHAEARAGGTLLLNQFFFSELDGRLLGVVRDMEGACSKALNRLAGETVSRRLEL